MSARVSIEIECDKCGRVASGLEDNAVAKVLTTRRNLKAIGWTYVRTKGEGPCQEICPRCSQEL